MAQVAMSPSNKPVTSTNGAAVTRGGSGGGTRPKRPSTREKIAKMVAEGAVNYPAYLKLIYTGDSEQEPSSGEEDELGLSNWRRTPRSAAVAAVTSAPPASNNSQQQQQPRVEGDFISSDKSADLCLRVDRTTIGL